MREIYFNPASYSKLFGEEKKQEDINAMMYSAEQRGKSEGKVEEKLKIAKSLLKNNISIDVIATTTDLTYDQINDLKVTNYSRQSNE